MKTGLTTLDNSAALMAALKSLVSRDVLVGIPSNKTDRNAPGDPAGNAMLGYIHEFGAPGSNIPARPFLMPGIKDAQPGIEEQLRNAALAALVGDKAGVTKGLDGAGRLAAFAAKARITAGIGPELKPGTIANRRNGRGTKSRRAGEKAYLAAIAQGVAPADAQAAAGILALVNTGQLRNSITYVIRKK